MCSGAVMFDDSKLNIAVIGAGAAGLMAAGYAGRLGANVTLFERNDRPGKKLMITGKGRCNVTNNCTVPEFIANIPRNPRFMYGALNGFSPADTIEFFEGLGVPLKTERGNRVFPVSDKSRDIVNALSGYAREVCRFVFERVTGIEPTDRRFSVRTEKGEYRFDRVIIATGGVSYPTTGSTGDGYRFARSMGLKLTDIRPSLVPLETLGELCRRLQGLSLKNVAIKVIDKSSGKVVYEDFGELMFTHFGITGPTVLSASAHIRDITPGKYVFSIDLKPALDKKTLDRRLLSDFAKFQNRDLINSLSDLLPAKLIDVFVGLSGIDPRKKVNSITKEERARMVDLLKSFELTVKRQRPIDEAVITSGGVDISEIDPKTMECKSVRGLFFAGEVIDVDAYTGGFNLQIAFATARLAAKNAAVSRDNKENKEKNDDRKKKGGPKKRTEVKKVFKIAIDGPSGAGKSTVAKLIAKELGCVYVDTGAMYRTIGFHACEKGIDKGDRQAIIDSLKDIDLVIEYSEGVQHMILNGRDVTPYIRTQEISMYASAVSSIPEVRTFLIPVQRDFAKRNNVVMDGRDIGTVIFPDAEVKIFLISSPESRAMRRYKELCEKGDKVDYETVLAQTIERDTADSTRAIAPAIPADDAVVLDNSELDIKQTFDAACEIIFSKVPEAANK